MVRGEHYSYFYNYNIYNITIGIGNGFIETIPGVPNLRVVGTFSSSKKFFFIKVFQREFQI